MSNIDNFKKFVSKNPGFIDYVKKNNVSWQSIYELYDLYGEDDDVWSKYLTTEKTDSLSIKGLFNTLKNINIDSLEENINSIQKAVGLVDELTRETKTEEKISKKEEKMNRIYGDDSEL